MLRILRNHGGDATLINVPEQLQLGYPDFVPNGMLRLRLHKPDGTVLAFDEPYSVADYPALIGFLNATARAALGLTEIFSLSTAGDSVQYLNAEGFTDASFISLAMAPLLDMMPGACLALSLRRLRTVYPGSAIRLRRGSDDAELDIGFAEDGYLDVAALETFLGGASGFVAVWYDQSGRGHHMVQPVKAFQPRIVANQFGSRYAVVSDGVDDYMQALFATPAVLPFCLSTILSIDGVAGQQCAINSYSSIASINTIVRRFGSNQVTTHGYRYAFSWPATSLQILVSNRSDSNGSLLRNGSVVAPLDQLENATDISLVRLFAETNYAATIVQHHSAAVMPELILWDSAAGDMVGSRTDVHDNINWYYNNNEG